MTVIRHLNHAHHVAFFVVIVVVVDKGKIFIHKTTESRYEGEASLSIGHLICDPLYRCSLLLCSLSLSHTLLVAHSESILKQTLHYNEDGWKFIDDNKLHVVLSCAYF